MHCTWRAPLLSAAKQHGLHLNHGLNPDQQLILNTVSTHRLRWVVSARFFDDLDQRPRFGFRDRTALANRHQITFIALISLVVHVQLAGTTDVFTYIGCLTSRSIFTVTDLSILLLTTRPVSVTLDVFARVHAALPIFSFSTVLMRAISLRTFLN